MTEDRVMAPNIQGPDGDPKPVETAAGETSAPSDRGSKQPAKKATKKQPAKTDKKPEAEKPSTPATWRAWEEYPGAAELATSRANGGRLNALVSCALVAHGFGEKLARLGAGSDWWVGNQEALVEFQDSRGIAESGFVGQETWDALGRDDEPPGLEKIFKTDGVDDLKGGSESDLALYVQALLVLNGYGEQLSEYATRDWDAGCVLALAEARRAYEGR